MKKILILFTALTALVFMVSCGDSPTGSSKNISTEDIAGAYMTPADDMGLAEYMLLFDDGTGELGDTTNMGGFGSMDPNYPCTWEGSASGVEVTFAMDYPFTYNEIVWKFDVSTNGDEITLTDVDDSEIYYISTSGIDTARVKISSTDLIGTWNRKNSSATIVFNQGGSGTDDGVSMSWEIADSKHAVFVIDSDNYYNTLWTSKDASGAIVLTDEDNNLTYTK